MKFVRVSGSRKLCERYMDGFSTWEKIQGDTMLLQEMYYDQGFRNIYSKELLPEYDLYRVGGLEGKYKQLAKNLIYYYGILHKKQFLDSVSTTQKSFDKIAQLICFEHYSYPTLKTMCFCPNTLTKEHIIDIITENFTFPLIVKNPVLDRGEGVEKIENQSRLIEWIEEYIQKKMNSGVLVQEFFKASCDYRALVMGDKVLGVFKRTNLYGYKHNISQGGIGEAVQISIALENLCVQATKSVGLDIGGVDFFRDGAEKVILIEINKMPQYAGFEKATRRDFLSSLYDFLAYEFI